MTQYIQNKPFHCNQKSLYEELGGKSRKTNGPPQTDDAGKSWSELSDNSKQRSNNQGGCNKTSFQNA